MIIMSVSATSSCRLGLWPSTSASLEELGRMGTILALARVYVHYRYKRPGRSYRPTFMRRWYILYLPLPLLPGTSVVATTNECILRRSCIVVETQCSSIPDWERLRRIRNRFGVGERNTDSCEQPDPAGLPGHPACARSPRPTNQLDCPDQHLLRPYMRPQHTLSGAASGTDEPHSPYGISPCPRPGHHPSLLCATSAAANSLLKTREVFRQLRNRYQPTP